VADDEEILALLRDSGAWGSPVGFETLSQKNIRDVGKGVNRTQEYLERIRKIHAYGIGLAGNFIFGFDQTIRARSPEVVRFVRCGTARGILLLAAHPLPGTPLYEQMQAEGRLLENGIGPCTIPTMWCTVLNLWMPRR